MLYIVTYDLNNEKDYTKLIDAIIRYYPNYWHIQMSAWIIESDEDAQSIFHRLNRYIDEDDEIFISKLTWDTAGKSTHASWDWFDKYIRNNPK